MMSVGKRTVLNRCHEIFPKNMALLVQKSWKGKVVKTLMALPLKN